MEMPFKLCYGGLFIMGLLASLKRLEWKAPSVKSGFLPLTKGAYHNDAGSITITRAIHSLNYGSLLASHQNT